VTTAVAKVYRWEIAKLLAQKRTYLGLGAAMIVPLIFVIVLVALVAAFLVIRPYLKSAVQVAVEDPADPTPYWLLSTRRPDRLVAALTPSRSGDTP